jgi:ketosteroid isomerase-like protein
MFLSRAVRPLASLLVFANTLGIGLSQTAQTPGRVLTPTKLVATFAELENAWLVAVQKKDSASLLHMLDEDFQVWSPDTPGATPKEDWEKTALSNPPVSFRIQHMTARPVRDDIAIVSFELTELPGNQKTAMHSFVVDVWSKQNARWRCTDRYVSKISGAPKPARPTGKN